MRISRLRSPAERVWIGTAVGCLLLFGSPASAGPALPAGGATTAAATAGFVSRSGGQLQVSGAPWRFAGYNLPCAQPFLLTADELGSYLDGVQASSNANVIRAWFFQSNGGPGSWAPFDRVVAAVKARGMRLVATLTDEWNGGCDAGPPNTEKTLDWYQGGYRQPDLGHTLAYRDYAAQVAARYAAEPAVAMWQLVNEAQAQTKLPSGQLTCDNTAGQLALRSFADDMVGVVKAADPNHLVNLGTLGGSQCGMAGTAAYQYIHSGLVDVCEYHDYGSSAAARPAGADLLAQRINDCRTLAGGPKPFFVGEAGVQGNVQPDGGPPPCQPWPGCSPFPVTTETLVQRADFFRAKIAAAFGAGVSGYVIWVKSPFYRSSGDIYAIGDGDPTEGALATALPPLPAAPTITQVKPCDRAATVVWSPPPGGPEPVGYDVLASNGITTAVAGTVTSVTVKGLVNGQSYSFRVAARGSEGRGPESVPSRIVLPHRWAKCRGRPVVARFLGVLGGRP